MLYDFAISLGSECFTNVLIKKNYGTDKKFYPSFPINNVKSFNFSKIILLFKNNFKDLLNKKYIIKKKKEQKNIKYDIIFIHEDILRDDSKLKLRLIRLKKLLSLNFSYLFIRIENIFSNFFIDSEIAKNNCKLFVKMIIKIYKIKNFKLLYIYEDKNIKEIELVRQRKYYDIYSIPAREYWEPNYKQISTIFKRYIVTYFNNHSYDDFLNLVKMKD